MKKTLNLCAFADEAGKSVEEQIIALKRNSIDKLEIRFIDGLSIAEITLNKTKKIFKQLSENDISVWSIGSPFGKIKVSDPFEPHLDSFKLCIEKAHILGAKCIRIFSFYGVTTNAERDVAMERLGAFVDAAKDSGLVLCHENEKGIYGETTENCLDIFKNFPKIKAVFDPANFVQCNVDVRKAWETLKPYVYYLHIKDSLKDGRVVPAGEGFGELKYVVDSFYKNGGGVMTLEPHLKVFSGLAELEADAKTQIDDYTYSDNNAAFDAACKAIKNIIANCNANLI